MSTTHHFTPIRYYNTLGAHEPALAVQPGDTVITTTVDARGQDAAGQRVTDGPNPQTGPFFVEGAEVGDTLVVRFDRITPNRPTGWSSKMLAEHVVDPWHVRQLPFEVENERAIWNIDLAAGTASLAQPEGRLGHFTLPLAPMLGCFGVAPYGGEVISAMTSGAHGGNMDYRGFTAGVTAYFVVLAPGALFMLGDGHALQGDGEMSGSGVEISMEVQFTLDLIKGKHGYWPRGENADYIFTLGNIRPLEQAVQHATTEMLKWLQSDYGLSSREANLLLGYCVEYDLGNMYDPAYTMVCKLPKRVLPQP